MVIARRDEGLCRCGGGRHYLEAGRGRADHYYLADGAGIGRCFTASKGRAVAVAPLTGDASEVWVAGLDLETGGPRGWLRTDDDDAAQDRAAEEIIGWCAIRDSNPEPADYMSG